MNQKRNCIPTLPYDGLPRVLGARGVMVVKDYTTILSMSGDARGDGREISPETGGRSGRPVNFNLSRDIQTDHLRSL